MTLENDPLLQKIAAGLFALALIHTFSVKQFERLAARSPGHAGLFHLLGEVEVVFGFWAFVLIACMAVFADGHSAVAYAESRNYTEPLFVFVVMVIAASRPILQAVETALHRLAHVFPAPTPAMLTWLSLSVVPLFGSLITEPAAMTIAALMLAPQVFQSYVPERQPDVHRARDLRTRFLIHGEIHGLHSNSIYSSRTSFRLPGDQH
jgi:hypothetical protein